MFTWQRVVDERVPAAQPEATQAEGASSRPVPPFWTAFQREQRLATELLRVHALSSAITYEPHAPLRVDAAQWWREIKQQSVAAVGQRTSRKRRLRQRTTTVPAKASPVLTGTTATDADTGPGTEPENEDVAIQQQTVHDLLVEVLVRILQSVSAWTQATERDRHNQVQLHILAAVEDAIGDVGVQLLNEWWHAPTLETEAPAAQHAAAHIVNVLLQVDDRIGSFHVFHDHKLCASTAQRLFRTTPRWTCSKCTRSWETHGVAVPILVFACAVCDYTLCRECFTRIPNATTELQEIALRQEIFQLPIPLHTQRFLPLVLQKAVAQDKSLFESLAPQLAIAARGRLQDLLLYRSQEMVPLMQIVIDLFAIREFPRVLIKSDPQLWLPMYISSAKLRLYSFMGPLMWWTSMSDEPGEINLTPEGRRDGSASALTLQWHDGYQELRAMLHRLFECIFANPTQDPFVVDAWLTYLATTIVCFQVSRSSGQNSDDMYDGILINMSSALVHVISPVLEARSHLIQTQYHESYVPQRVYHYKAEPLRSPPVDDEPAIRAADDRRVQQTDTQRRAHKKELYYPPNDKHCGVLCDFCHCADFEGLRFKCAVCDDADICASCYEDFSTRPILSNAQQEVEKARCGDEFHSTDHLFVRIDVPVPLIAANHYTPVEFQKAQFLYSGEKNVDGSLDTAEGVARELECAECNAHLDEFDVFYRCSNCLDPRLVCPACVAHEERHHDPNQMHLPGHLYIAIPRPWRQIFNPRRPGLYSRGLVYPACIYPRERFNTETEVFYLTIEALHVGPLHTLAKVLAVVKEMYELRSFCACEEQRVEREKALVRSSGRRPPKLSAHYTASQTRLADLGATRLMAEMHLLEASNVVAWITFYARTCRWLLELASPTQNAFKTILTEFSTAFSSFPQHFFFDLCDMVHVLTLDGTTSTASNGNGSTVGGIDYQHAMARDATINQSALLEPLLAMLVQLIATRECTKNPHLRVHAAKALSSLVSFYAKNNTLIGALRKVFQRCVVLREFAVLAVLQFHEDMEGYHIRNNGLVFNNNAGNGDHLLWGFVSIRTTSVLLLRFLWQFTDQRDALARAFRMKSRTPEQAAAVAGDPEVDAIAEAHIAHQVSVLISGLWSDAAKLFEEGNSKVGVLIQLTDIREALQDGRPIQLPFRPSMLEGYIALHSKHLRISMRMLVEVLELLSWMADNLALKRALLKPELADQCARTTSFLMSSVGAAFQAKTLDFTWHHLADSKRVMAHLVFLVTRCAGALAGSSDAGGKALSTSSCSPSPCWSLIQESGHAMLRFIGDIEVHNRWTLNRAVVRMELARYLGEDTGEEFDARSTETRSQSPKNNRPFSLGGGEDLDEHDALSLLEQQSAEALTTLTTQGLSGGGGAGAVLKGQRRSLARQLGNRFVSALAKDGRFDYEGFVAGCDLLLRRSSKATQATDADRDYEFVGLSWVTLYRTVLRRCQDMVSLQAAMDELLSDIPEEFLDPLLSTIMTDPVRLPSGNIVDRSVIERHLLTANRVDPFTREPLTAQMLTPCEPLRREIQAYVRAKLQHLEYKKEDVLASWGLAWDCIFDGVADL